MHLQLLFINFCHVSITLPCSNDIPFAYNALFTLSIHLIQGLSLGLVSHIIPHYLLHQTPFSVLPICPNQNSPISNSAYMMWLTLLSHRPHTVPQQVCDKKHLMLPAHIFQSHSYLILYICCILYVSSEDVDVEVDNHIPAIADADA